MSYNRLKSLAANVAAIETAVTVHKQRRKATQEEKQVLAQYSGFGGVKEVLTIGTQIPMPEELAEQTNRLQEVLRTLAGGSEGDYDLLYVVNRSRNLTHDPAEALCVLREIEAASRLHATAVANNTHLADFTDGEVLSRGVGFAQEVAALAGLPLAFSAVPRHMLEDADIPGVRYPVSVHVRKPWE